MNIYYKCLCLILLYYIDFPVGGVTLNDTDLCDLENGKKGTCIPLTTCEAYTVVLKEASTTLEGLRLVREHMCGFDGLDSKVCCPLETNNKLKIPDDIGIDALDSRFPELNPEDYIESFPDPPKCGKVDSGPDVTSACDGDVDFRLRNGRPAYKGISNWMALLGYKDASVFWQCGGSIITVRHVLTAAHCIKNNLYLVRVGEIDYAHLSSSSPGQPTDYLIKKAIRHEDYSKFHNDIGLLVTQEEIHFNDYVRPICLPVAGRSYTKLEVPIDPWAPGPLMVEGWGVTENGSRPTHLQYTFVSKLDLDVCRKVYKGYNVTIDARVVCAGADLSDACQGDSGSPLLGRFCTKVKGSDEENSFYYQLGIVSYGFTCPYSRFASLYTSVEHYMPWLQDKILGVLR